MLHSVIVQRGWRDGPVGKGAAHKPSDLGQIPGIHIEEEGENKVQSCSLTSTCTCDAYTHIVIIKIKTKLNNKNLSKVPISPAL